MKWLRVPSLIKQAGMTLPAKAYWRSDDDVYVVYPSFGRGRRGRRLKSVVWRLTERKRPVGKSFASARLAKAFADALAALGDDRRARAEFIRNGGEWCYQKENEWRRKRDDAAFARYDARRLPEWGYRS